MAITKIQYDNKVAINIDSTIPDINKCNASDLNEIKSVVNNNADEIPTKTSDLTNDSGYITKDVNDLTNYVKKTDYATSIKSGVIYAEPQSGFMIGPTGKPYPVTMSYSDYTSLTNTYFISKGTLENVISGKGLIDKNVNNLTNYTLSSSLSSVATSGSYNDLTNKPTIPSNDKLVNVGISVDSNYRTNILYSHNLFDKDNANILDATINSSSKLIESSSQYKCLYIPCEANTTYTISKVQSGYLSAGFTDTLPTTNVEVKNYTISADTTNCTLTSLSTSKYLIIRYWRINDTLTESEIRASIQIELGSTATSYEPYITPSINVDGERIYNSNINHYSLNEINTGMKWINGKPIYRIVYQGQFPNASVTSWTELFTISNFDKTINVYGALETSGNNPIPRYEENSFKVLISINQSGRVAYKQSGYNNDNFHLIVEYTKTTD